MNDNKVGTSNRSLIVAGHSHMHALHLARASLNRPVEFLKAPWPQSDESWDAIADRLEDADLALVFGGNEHNLYFFESDAVFDLVSRQVDRLIPSIRLVPKSAIRRTFMAAGMSELPAILERLKTKRPRKLALIGTPPPKKDSDALRERLKSEPFFAELAAQMGGSIDTIPITSPYVRLKLWYLLQDMLEDIARKASVEFISVSPETQDGDGFLKSELWAEDVTHANAAYGQLMWPKIAATFAA